MRKLHLLLAVVLLLNVATVSAQSKPVDSIAFFLDDKPIELTISTDIRNLLNKRAKREYQPADITMRFPDSSTIKEQIRIQTRGIYRLNNCYMPSLMLNFRNPTSPQLSSLQKLKLVCGCGTSSDDEQLIIKEYLTYKIYNLLTPMSFRVRMLRVTYEDSKEKKKPYTQYGFFIEDVDDMAHRNKCDEQDQQVSGSEQTDRQQMTLVSIFQYMVGNLDWSVPGLHNMKLIRSQENTKALPFAVPYDFDYCGLVNAPYAAPPEQITEIKSVTERYYRGFPRTMEELEPVIANFLAQKEKTLSLISNCQWLSNRYKKEVTNFLEDFYKQIENKTRVRNLFIENARTI
ncbi:MAG TPA: hypothetical protein VF476_15840 [Chitinophagaceae bacterium]